MAHASDTVLRLCAGYHANLLSRDLGQAALPEASLPTDATTLGVWQAALTAPLEERQALAYLLTLSLPTPHLSGLQERLRPLLHFDIIGRLPVDLARAIFAELDLRSIVTCSLVCQSWRRLAHADQLLWRSFYERAGWRYDERAVAYWNALGSSWSVEGEAMAIDEPRISPLLQISPEEELQPSAPSSDYFDRARRVSNTLGLPPSPRHVDFPAPAPRAAAAGTETWRQRLRANRERAARPSSPTPPDTLAVESLEFASSRHDPFELRLPQRSSLDLRVTPPRRLQLARSSHRPEPPPSARDLVAPRSLVAAGVSSEHYDHDGRPAVNWRYMVRARHEARRNWRRGVFATHDIRPPVESGGEQGVYAVQFDGRHVVCGAKDAMARMYDLETGELVRVFAGHGKSVLCLQFDDERFVPDGQALRLITGSSDCTAIAWDLDTGRALQTFVVRGVALGGVG